MTCKFCQAEVPFEPTACSHPKKRRKRAKGEDKPIDFVSLLEYVRRHRILPSVALAIMESE